MCTESDDGCYPDTASFYKNVDPAFEAKATVKQHAIWSEFKRSFGDVTTRFGLRYDRDDFLKNNNLAPRFVTSWEYLPDTSVTFGANRYYSRSMIGYAILEQYPEGYVYYRPNLFTNDLSWTLLNQSSLFDYSGSDLKTPYSDELSLTFTFPTALDGALRIKGIKRFYREQFSAGKDENDADILTNEGKSSYNSVSIEWGGTYDSWSLGANLTWSETHSVRGSDYLDRYNEDYYKNRQVYYKGELVSEEEINQENQRQNFAAPLKANITVSKVWLDNKARTTLLASYLGAYETITEIDETIAVDGVDYDVYDKVKYESFTSLNLNNHFQLYNSDQGKLSMNLRIDNLLGKNRQSNRSGDAHYERGRSYWINLDYSY